MGLALEQLRTIRLYGKLGAKFGREHRLAVESVSEAVQALSVILPGFERFLMESKAMGLAYACFLGRRNVGEDDLEQAAGAHDIRIAPMLMGSKRGGLFQMVLGAALVVGASLAMPGSTGMFAALGAKGVYGAVALMGATMFLGGAVAAIAPQQKGLSTKDGPNNGASYNFNGPVNTTAQGNCRPVLYGRITRVGGSVLSTGIYAEDQQ